jgi:hypothetical protein
MSIARNQLSRRGSLIHVIKAVFYGWSMQSVYKEVFGSVEQYRTVVESSSEIPVCQDMSLGVEELN